VTVACFTVANPLHAPLLAAIHAAAVSDTERWPETTFVGLLGQPASIGLIDPTGGFALARAAGGEAELLMLAVHPERRREGRARALLAAIEGAARGAGAMAMFLEVHEANLAARSLYDAAGYREVGVRSRYYADGGSARLLRRDLTRDGSAAG
jgi:ribosomal-protein-alanine N-acetyltransferase